MNFTHYFIKHRVTALVLNAMIILVGVLCLGSLSVREYPTVNFPTLTVQAFYPNASAELVETTVTNALEDKLAGVEGLDSMISNSKEGSCSIDITFRVGTSMDRAMIAVRDAISLARENLPIEVKDPIVQVKGKSEGVPFMAISIESASSDFGALTHYANLNLKNAFRSLKGVASAQVYGQPYTYAITLDPKKMFEFGVNADDVYNALKRNSLSLPVGKFQNEIPTTLDAELLSVEDYKRVLVKEKNFNDPKNKIHPVFLESVATVELKTDDSQFRVRINGNPGLCICINPANDANPLEVSDLVHAQVEALRQSMPPTIKVSIVVDGGEFIRASISNIKSSIIEAIAFVLCIVFLFLRNFRATLIPLVTIPISLIGSLVFLKLFGFSINIVTLLAMVLAVGLVVDDAIVVLENITRHIEHGLSPLEAAIRGSKEIGFAIIAMTLTLTSVYAPIAFIHGAMGQLLIEFSVALAGSVLISGIVALTLSPWMCATFLKDKPKELWPQIDVFLNKLSENYGKLLERVITKKIVGFLIALGSIGLTLFFFKVLPSEIAPKEDRSLVGIFINTIPGKDINTMETYLVAAEKLIQDTPEAESSLAFIGDFGGTVVLPLKPKADRKRSAIEIMNSFWPKFRDFPSVDVWPWSVDSGLPGLQDAMGNGEAELIISTTDGYKDLFKNVDQARKVADEQKLFKSVHHNLRLDTLGYSIDLDTNAMAQLNLQERQVAKMIEVFFSGDKSLTFQKDGLLYAITLQGKPSPWTLNELYLTNPQGKHISIGTFSQLKTRSQPKALSHYNQMHSVSLKGELKPGEKIENAMPKLWKVAAENLPKSYKKSWAGEAKAYLESSSTMVILLLLALVFVYAILAIQFESFLDPFIILFTIPLAASGALFFAWAFGQSLNIFTQVGLITLIGLITKHGILIVEFANQLKAQGEASLPAIKKAAIQRLRPILMTTGAMIFGAIPLVLSSDAGSEARRAIGVILIGGLSFGTFFTLFVLPTIYLALKSFRAPGSKK